MSEIHDGDTAAAGPGLLVRRVEKFDRALTELAEAAPFAKVRYQKPAYRLAADLMETDEGMALLAERADRFDEAGLFRDGPWADPAKLVPDLVGYGLTGEGAYSIIEILSELRMLALAEGRCTADGFPAAEARDFLRNVCAKNLHLMFLVPSEDSRNRPRVYERAERLFRLVRSVVELTGLHRQVLDEIEALTAQRPIQTDGIERLLNLAERIPDSPDGSADDAALKDEIDRYRLALGPLTDLSREAGDVVGYRARLQHADRGALAAEAEAFGASLAATGLGSPYHAVLLRRLCGGDPDLLGPALALNDTGLAELDKRGKLMTQLVTVAVFPATAASLYGLKRTCERGLLSRSEVASGLRRLVDLDILPEVRELLLQEKEPNLTANAVLVAGTLSVLGQPLGVSQGNNPTCQAARGISLWSLHAPGLLLEMIAVAARDGLVESRFEGHELSSRALGARPGEDGSRLGVDPVSTVLIPHLDVIYARMMQLATLRGEDPHKWVNPALYGRWVNKGFASVIDPTGTTVRGYGTFVRRFYATHHPDYNAGHEMIYPNPVGILVTSAHGALLGPHAVSLQRIARDPDGRVRAYFFNPNHEGRQDWGQGIRPTVHAHGERPGESSLPFRHLAARLYAFHYNPYEEGDAFAVPDDIVREITDLARESWGAAYTWID